MQKQMVEIRAWKKNRGLTNETDLCRMCGKFSEGVLHLALGCEFLAGSQYLTRHNNNVLKILTTAWTRDNQLLDDDQCWYKLCWRKNR